jgi:hypothetical protein
VVQVTPCMSAGRRKLNNLDVPTNMNNESHSPLDDMFGFHMARHRHRKYSHRTYMYTFTVISACQMVGARFKSQADFKSNVTSIEPQQPKCKSEVQITLH